jgi:hypothetical protein
MNGYHNVQDVTKMPFSKHEVEEFSPFENFLLNLLKRNGSDLGPN